MPSGALVVSAADLDFREGAATSDVVVLAGDINNGNAGAHWAKELFPEKQVVYVLGNHEFWLNSFQALPSNVRTFTRARWRRGRSHEANTSLAQSRGRNDSLDIVVGNCFTAPLQESEHSRWINVQQPVHLGILLYFHLPRTLGIS